MAQSASDKENSPADLRERAGRVRRIAADLTNREAAILLHYADELEARAKVLEKQEADKAPLI